MNKGMPVEFFYILLLSTIGAELMLHLRAAIETGSHKILVFTKSTYKIHVSAS